MLSQSHLTEVGATLCEYRRQNFLCDTELCTSNNKLKAHSVLLAAVSPVFKSVFEMSGAAGMYCINLPGIGSEELEIALHFIYTGTLLLPLCYRLPGELSRLFVLMEQLGLDSQKFDGCEMTFKSESEHPDGGCYDDRMLGSDEATGNFESDYFKLKSGADDKQLLQSREVLSEKISTQETESEANSTKNLVETDNDVVKMESLGDITSHSQINYFDEKPGDLDCGDLAGAACVMIPCPPGGAGFSILELSGQQTEHVQPVFVVQVPKGNGVASLPQELSDTVAETTKRKTYGCSTCGKGYASIAILEKHQLVHTGEKPYVCSFCDKAFSMKSNLERHEKRHTGIRPHLCELCGKGFIQKTALLYHTRTHQGELGTGGCKPGEMFSCSVCSLAFNRHANLRKHMRNLHSAPELDENRRSVERKSLLCDLCGKGFASVNSLKLHRMQHTGEKPFVCSICDKAFVVKAQLQYHARLHTGEKPFVCPTCGKGFVGKLGLTQHIRTHTGERPYICTVCGKAFTQSTHLKGHMRSHTGEKPNICHLCGKAYKNRLDLRFHYSRIHGLNITRPKQQVLKIEQF